MMQWRIMDELLGEITTLRSRQKRGKDDLSWRIS
jgi:hypothetical protein